MNLGEIFAASGMNWMNTFYGRALGHCGGKPGVITKLFSAAKTSNEIASSIFVWFSKGSHVPSSCRLDLVECTSRSNKTVFSAAPVQLGSTNACGASGSDAWHSRNSIYHFA